jgi:uncharacterized membrane protein
MIADLPFILVWWLVITALGWLFLPLTTHLFNRFFDKGYIFSKTLGLFIVTYLTFVLGVFKLVPFTNLSVLAIALIAGVVLYRHFQKQFSLFDYFSKHWRLVVIYELVFIAIFVGWAYVRGHAPDIESLEKFMDWGFINSMLRTQYFPPQDMWYAGESINYYYFGHLVFALLTKLTSLDSAITYNLAIASLSALVFTSAFSVTANLVYLAQAALKKVHWGGVVVAGLVSAVLLTFGGNLHPIYKIAKINIEQNQKLVLTPEAVSKSAASYWYPDATRFIGFDPDVKDKTIHEFPLYSLVVSDLHGHLNNIPLVLTIIAFLIVFFTRGLPLTTFRLDLVVPLSFFLALAYMTNAWDFAVYGMLFGITFLLTQARHLPFLKLITSVLSHGLSIIVLWYLFTLPFSLHFKPMAEGIRLSDVHTPFYQLFVLYGGFWLLCFPLVLWVLKKIIKRTTVQINDFDLMALALVVTATILIIIPELMYIKDIYIFEHRRANTMFKLVYQAFMIYSLSAGYVLYRLRSYYLYRFLFVLILVLHMIYPYFAIRAYSDHHTPRKYWGLYGLDFLKDQYPDNYQAILWINENIKGQPVMLEAVGDSYTQFNQISMATGLPTVEGWLVHEWLWRGGFDGPGARQTDVQKIFESTDLDTTRSLISQYRVKYIFVGPKEKEKYPALNTQKFIDLGSKLVFQSGETSIYQLP